MNVGKSINAKRNSRSMLAAIMYLVCMCLNYDNNILHVSAIKTKRLQYEYFRFSPATVNLINKYNFVH